MAYTDQLGEARFTTRDALKRENALRERYRPVGIGAVAAAKCIRTRTRNSNAHDVPAILNCERDSD